MSYSIREVDGTDDDIAEELRCLHMITFADTAAMPDFNEGRWWMAKCDKRYVAFIGFVPSLVGSDTAYFKRVGVIEKHRGHGLQTRLMRTMERAIRKAGYARIVSDTTDNPHSANNMFRGGYRIWDSQWKWTGMDETIYWEKVL